MAGRNGTRGQAGGVRSMQDGGNAEANVQDELISSSCYLCYDTIQHHEWVT